jgi:hypothetical protein
VCCVLRVAGIGRAGELSQQVVEPGPLEAGGPVLLEVRVRRYAAGMGSLLRIQRMLIDSVVGI